MSEQKTRGLTLDQINYRLRAGTLSSKDAEEAVKWWNENRVSTTAYIEQIQSGILTIPQVRTKERP